MRETGGWEEGCFRGGLSVLQQRCGAWGVGGSARVVRGVWSVQEQGCDEVFNVVCVLLCWCGGGVQWSSRSCRSCKGGTLSKQAVCAAPADVRRPQDDVQAIVVTGVWGSKVRLVAWTCVLVANSDAH